MWPRSSQFLRRRTITSVGVCVCLAAAGTAVAVADTTDAAWVPPIAIPDGAVVYSPTLAASADGSRLVAGWHSDSGVRVSLSDDGGGTWTPARRVVADKGVLQLRILSSGDGEQLLAVWRRLMAREGVSFTVPRVRFSVSANGGRTWTAARTAPTDGLRDHRAESVMSADGRWQAVAYAQKGEGVKVIRSRNGGVTWSRPRTVSAGIPGTPDVQGPQLAGSRDGRHLVVAWQQRDGALQVSRSANGGRTWSAPRAVATVQRFVVPEVAISADGQSTVLAWVGKLAGAPAQEPTPMMVATGDGAHRLSDPRVIGIGDPDNIEVDLVIARDGRQVSAAWSSPAGASVSHSGDGGRAWAVPTTLSTAADPGYPAMAGSSDGRRLVATWWSGGSLQAVTSLDGGASWAPPRTITDTTGTYDPLASAVGDTRLVCAEDGVRLSTLAVSTGPDPLVVIRGTSPASPQNPASPIHEVDPWSPSVITIARATRADGALRVRVTPRLRRSLQWRFIIRKREGDGWRTLRTGDGARKTYRTKGTKHVRVVNLPKGVYKVRALPARGYRGDTSTRVKLRY